MPIPQLLGRDDVTEGGSWDIRSALPLRGSPSTCIEFRQMNVPMGNSLLEDAIRAHEMLHAKVSPTAKIFKGFLDRGFAAERTIIVAEETRVNYLGNQLGFPIAQDLADGREFIDGRMLASSDWKQCMYGYVATSFTAGQEPYVNGVEEINPAWADQLRYIGMAIDKHWEEAKSLYKIDGIAKIDSDKSEYGFEHTYQLAIKLELWAGSESIIESIDDITSEETSDPSIQKIMARGGSVWDDLRFSPVKPTQHVVGAISKKRIAMQYGKNPRRMSRLYTDPQKRIFDHTVKSPGGIVVIDGSGSMSLRTEQIKEMILAAPGCTVVIYSSSDDLERWKPEHNIFFLAENGKMVEERKYPDLFGGNGVDLPAIKWAVGKRKSRKTPVIWVTDGYVHTLGTETLNCALFAQKQGVLMAQNADEAVEMLRDIKRRRPVKSSTPWSFRRALSSDRLS